MKHVIFGDVSGHLEPLQKGLATQGVHLSADNIHVPDDITVVQVGDLVHKGPDSDEIVDLVDVAMTSGQWVQLIGNHEAHYLGGPQFGHWTINYRTEERLWAMMEAGTLKLAHAIDTKYGPTLITHAGMTSEVWRMIGSPSSPHDAAHILNGRLLESDLARSVLFKPGVMLSGPTADPGVVWAEPQMELWPSWRNINMPFAQIHGHASAFRWGKRRFNWGVPDYVEILDCNLQLRQLKIRVGGNVVISIDPGYGKYAPARPLLPLLLHA